MNPSLEDRIKKVVIKILGIEESVYSEELAAGDIPEWDSVAQVQIIQAVEEEFHISFEIPDAIDIEDIGDLIEMVKKYTIQK